MGRRPGRRRTGKGDGGVRYFGIALVYAWRYTLGLLTPTGTCKYHPSCSHYAIDAFRAQGLLKGAVLAGWRLLRCNPWSDGGVDYAANSTLFTRRRNRDGARST